MYKSGLVRPSACKPNYDNARLDRYLQSHKYSTMPRHELEYPKDATNVVKRDGDRGNTTISLAGCTLL